jgi:pteridine reductase
MKIRDKNILITGASKRIGRALAVDLASQGANIIIHYLNSAKGAELLKKEIEEKYAVKAFTIKANLAVDKVEPVIKKMLSTLDAKVGSIDVLINNASIFFATPLEKITEEEWDAFQSIHIKSSFFLSRAIGLKMKKRKIGKIINIVDSATSHPDPDFLPYIISKSALNIATVGLAKALAPYVQVNGVAPGPILPPEGAGNKEKKRVIKTTLLNRFGDPADIVATVNYLLSGTDYVTGVIIPVDGGRSIA